MTIIVKVSVNLQGTKISRSNVPESDEKMTVCVCVHGHILRVYMCVLTETAGL